MDCPDHSTFLPALVNDDRGQPLKLPNAICVFERYIGDPAWRHFEVFAQGESTSVSADGRPDTELVVRSASVIGNYDYLIDYRFRQNGEIHIHIGATGQNAVGRTGICDRCRGDVPRKLGHEYGARPPAPELEFDCFRSAYCEVRLVTICELSAWKHVPCHRCRIHNGFEVSVVVTRSVIKAYSPRIKARRAVAQPGRDSGRRTTEPRHRRSRSGVAGRSIGGTEHIGPIFQPRIGGGWLSRMNLQRTRGGSVFVSARVGRAESAGFRQAPASPPHPTAPCGGAPDPRERRWQCGPYDRFCTNPGTSVPRSASSRSVTVTVLPFDFTSHQYATAFSSSQALLSSRSRARYTTHVTEAPRASVSRPQRVLGRCASVVDAPSGIDFEAANGVDVRVDERCARRHRDASDRLDQWASTPHALAEGSS